jgi:hypothetical protein
MKILILFFKVNLVLATDLAFFAFLVWLAIDPKRERSGVRRGLFRRIIESFGMKSYVGSGPLYKPDEKTAPEERLKYAKEIENYEEWEKSNSSNHRIGSPGHL